MDLWLFFKALIKHGWILLGSAFVTILSFVSSAMEKTNSWSTYATAVMAFGLFFVAAFLAWRDEHRHVQALDNERPRIFLEWIGSTSHGLSQVIRITNQGSILATNARLYHKIVDDKKIVDDMTISFEPEILPGVEVGSLNRQCRVTVARTRQVSNSGWSTVVSTLREFMQSNSLDNLQIYCTYSDMHGRTFTDTFQVVVDFHGLTIRHGKMPL
jgi:hypothetical protein